jgi:hydrogenase maturation protease
MQKVLIIGYGNRFRTDDGVGVRAAESLAKEYSGDSAVRVVAAHQLTPEMAADIAEVDEVIFLDAAADGIPGTICKTPVTVDDTGELLAHNCTPSALLSIAQRLYGRSPLAVSLTMSAASFELGEYLSPAIEARMSELLDLAREIVSASRGTRHDNV